MTVVWFNGDQEKDIFMYQLWRQPHLAEGWVGNMGIIISRALPTISLTSVLGSWTNFGPISSVLNLTGIDNMAVTGAHVSVNSDSWKWRQQQTADSQLIKWVIERVIQTETQLSVLIDPHCFTYRLQRCKIPVHHCSRIHSFLSLGLVLLRLAAVIVWHHRFEGITKRFVIRTIAKVFMSVKFWRARPFTIKCRTLMLKINLDSIQTSY